MSNPPEIGSSNEGTKRHLQARHIEMIAIGGTIGTGLFIKSGAMIVDSGALGTLLSYLIAGITVFCVVMSLGEMATFMPVSGSFNTYAERFVDPALGFTSGWSYWLQWVLALPVEIQAASAFLGFWWPDANQTVIMVVLLGIILLLNLITVKAYGETEFILSIIKVIAIVVFIIVGIKIIATSGAWKFGAWSEPDPFNGKGYISLFPGIVGACFSFAGTELVGITAGEAANPRVSVPKAINGTFWRIMVFYIASVLIIGMLLSANYLSAKQEEDALLQSPFVLIFQQGGIPYADHIMNFIGFIAVFSAANSSVYASSRTMMSLSKAGQGLSLFAKTSSHGVPIWGVLISVLFGALSLLTLLVGSTELFDFLTNLGGLYVICTWIFICITHIRFRRAYLLQGYKLEDLPYVSKVGVAGDYCAIVFLVAILFLFGLPFDPFDATLFVKNYIGLLVYPLLYIGFKLYHSKTVVPICEIDLHAGNSAHFADDDEETAHNDENDEKVMINNGFLKRLFTKKTPKDLD